MGLCPFILAQELAAIASHWTPSICRTRAKKFGFIPRFIETAGEINEFMKMHVINLVKKGLKQVGKQIYGSKVTIMGLAYKKNINDPRESPSIKIIEELENLGAIVQVYDPFVSSIRTKAGVFNRLEASRRHFQIPTVLCSW